MEIFMKFFDLFCGVGGFRLGMERNGNVCIGSCEIDTYARQTYAKNFGHEPEFRDARDIDPARLPDFQCLCAGFPCQAFSIAGVRRGFEDTRGTLFFEIVRIAREKQPPILFLENVKGLLSHDKGQTFRVMLQTLDELGYDCEWQIINSKYFVPQNRERIFIIGHLRGSGSRKILPIGESNQIDVNSKQIQHSSTITANYWKGDGAGRPFIAEPEAKHVNLTEHNGSRVYFKDGIAPSVMAGQGSGTRIKIAEPEIKRVDGNPNVYNTDAQAGKIYDTDGISPTITGHRVNSQGFIAEPEIKYAQNSNSQADRVYDTSGIAPTLGKGNAMSKPLIPAESKKVTMVMNANKNSNMKKRIQERDETWTLTGNGNDFKLLNNYRIRRLTPIECERLQGFPDGWTDRVSDTQRYRQMGNAITVDVVQYIASFFSLD